MLKTKNAITLGTTLVVLFWFGLANAKSKIGIVNSDEIFGSMKETRNADSALRVFYNELSSQLENDRNAFEANLLQYQKDSATLTPEERSKIEDKLRRDGDLLFRLEQGANEEVERRKEQLLVPIRLKLNNAIQEVAKEEGFTLILFKEHAAFFLESDDITDKVKLKLGMKVN